MLREINKPWNADPSRFYVHKKNDSNANRKCLNKKAFISGRGRRVSDDLNKTPEKSANVSWYQINMCW